MDGKNHARFGRAPRRDSASEDRFLAFFLAGREPWICERVNTHPNNAEGCGSGSSGSGSGERSGWMERWMDEMGVNFVRLTIGFNFNACAT